MRICTSCGHKNPDDIEICLHCAAVLGQACPSCGQPVPTGNKFCGQCGSRLPEATTAVAASRFHHEALQNLRSLMPATLAEKINAAAVDILGERREVTVLFVDVMNFTAATRALDSEDVYLLIDEAMRLLVQVVYKYEGTIDKFTGDGLMALFGAPVTHENDPERALRAGLEMLATLQPLRERIRQAYSLDFQVRIGVNTGLVIAGEVGSDLHMEYTVIGDTVNLASRLEAAAEPGTILASFATYQHTRPLFRFKALPPFSVKGVSEPIRAYRPLSIRERPGRVRGLPGLQVPMIGRSQDLATLQDTLETLRQSGRTQVVLVTGEAGLGKSRLVAEFVKTLGQSDVGIYQGSCLAYARSTPLYVVADLLRGMLHVAETEPADTQFRALQSYLDQFELANDEVLPYLANLLGLAQTDPTSEARLRHLDASVLQRQTHAALRQIILAEVHLAPTVLIFEDLHWVDSASREFLEYLIQATVNVPLMVILVSRDIERDTVLRPLVAACEKLPERLVDLQLKALSEAEAQLLVDQLVKQTTDEARAIKQRITRRAEGNPFYVEEIVRMLIDQGGLDEKDGIWHVTEQAETLLQKVPGTLKGLIMARFDRLPERLRRRLQRAAVLGRSFPVRLLQMLSDTDNETIVADLDELAQRQFLIREPFGSERGYAFRHALIQDAVYGTLLRRDRRQIHEQIALTIEDDSYGSHEEKIEALAYHHSQSTNPGRAIPYLIDAADNAARRNANENAIQHYRQALALLDHQPGGSGSEFFRAQIGLGRTLKFVGEFAEANQILSDTLQHLLHWSLAVEAEDLLPVLVDGLRELADIRQREGAYDEAICHLEAGLQALGFEGAHDHPGLWRVLLDRMAWIRFRQGSLEQAFNLASSATAGLQPDDAEDPITLASLYNTLGGVRWQQGKLSEAVTYVERSLELYRSLGYFWGMGVAYVNLGVLHDVLGQWPKSIEYYEQARQLQQVIGDIQNEAVTLNNLGFLRMLMGEHEAARRDLENGLAIGLGVGDNWIVAQSRVSLAQLAIILSKIKDAASNAQAALTLADTVGSSEIQIQARWILALVEAQSGDLNSGLKSAEQAWKLAGETGLQDLESDCLRVLGVLRARAGDLNRAEEDLCKSIELSIQQDDPYRKGMALLELGKLYLHLARGDRSAGDEWRVKAHETLVEASAKFNELGAAYDLQLARTALHELQAGLTGEELPEGERRPAAIVWLNLSLSGTEDEEALFEAVALATRRLRAIAEDEGGRVVSRADGLLVIFGAPSVHEDDPERAANTAWRMSRYLAEASFDTEVTLEFRLAVSQGEVVAGELGHQSRADLVVQGEPVEQAQKLAQAAPAGKVWVTAAIRARTEHRFIFTAVEAAGGMASAVSKLERPRPQSGLARGLKGVKTQLVGRETPLTAMLGLTQSLQRGHGGVIWIEGEAGIGKSRLMREFAQAVTETGALVWSGQCSPQKTSQAFSLFSSLLRSMFELHAVDAPMQIQAKIEQICQTWPVGAQATQPYLEMLLGIRPSGQAGERLAGLEPDQLRQQTFVALRSLLKSLATEQPLVILLDDLHWIDPMSAELLLFLSNMITSLPVLFVCAQRWEESGQNKDRALKVQSLHPAQTVRLFLDRLPRVESEQLLNQLVTGGGLPEELRTLILERSAGNPYYLEEFVRMLIERGYLREDGHGDWEMGPGFDPQSVPWPSSLEGLIRARLDALPDGWRLLLQWAAVLGRPFETALLESISGQDDLPDSLGRLEARGMLVHTASNDLWQFRHSLVENTVYRSLLKPHRKALHRRVAQVLEGRWAGVEEEHAEELAYHFSQAEEGAKALNYLVLAGERAASRYANEEARSYFEQAAELLVTQPEATDQLRWRIAAGLGDVYRFIAQYPESKAALETGLALVEGSDLSDLHRAGLFRRLGETAQKQGELDTARRHFATARSLLSEPADRPAQLETARTLTRLAWTHFLQGHFDQAHEAAEAGLVWAQQAGGLSELAMVENLLGGICYRQGNLELALGHTMKAMGLREQMGYTWGVAATSSNLGILAVAGGHWQRAREYFERSLALRQDVGDVEGVAIVHHNLGALYRDQGDLKQAEAHFRASLKVAEDFKMAYHIASGTLGLAQVLLLQGKVPAAQETLSTSLARAETIGAQDLLVEIYRVQAEILLTQSDWAEAIGLAQQSAGLAVKNGNRSQEAAAWRVVAECEMQRDQPQAAHKALAKAWRALNDVIDRLEAARVAAQAGRLCLYEGDTTQAKKYLHLARKIFKELEAHRELSCVEVVLEQTGTGQLVAAGYWLMGDVLRTRER